MTSSLLAVLFWTLAANASGLILGNDARRRAAGVLVAAGVPLLGWLTVDHGPWIGLAGLAAGAAMLRWPLPDIVRDLRHGTRRQARPVEE